MSPSLYTFDSIVYMIRTRCGELDYDESFFVDGHYNLRCGDVSTIFNVTFEQN